MNWIKTRSWLPIGLAFAVLCCVSALFLFSRLVENSVIRDAERSSVAWAEYAAERLTRIGDLAQGAEVTPQDRAVIEDIAEFGHAFRFKLFSADGRLRFVSEDATAGGPDLGEHNESAASVIATGQPYTVIADGREKADRPDLYSETYLPVIKDGDRVAIVEVYFDQTETRAAIRADYAMFGLAILVLSGVGLGGPLVALFFLLRQLKRRNQQLDAERLRAEAADKAKTEFLGNVTHELRTPMNGVLGLAELLETQPLDDEGREMLDMLKSSATEQVTLINELLDITKIESGDLKLTQGPFDPAEVVRDVAAFMAPVAAQKKLDLALAPDLPDGHVLVGDRGAFKRVCMNLVGNAVKFTETGSVRIDLAVLPAAGSAAVSLGVTDTGCGISDADKDRIFERFVQVDGSLARAGEGTGLGLAITRALVDLMDGRIDIDSTLGRGTTFRVDLDLPVAEAVEDRIAA